MDILKKILKSHGYKLIFTPLHKADDILKYKNRKDAVDRTKYLTIVSKSGHVVGRLHNVPEGQRSLSSRDFQHILEMFSIFDIPKRKHVMADIRNMFKN